MQREHLHLTSTRPRGPASESHFGNLATAWDEMMSELKSGAVLIWNITENF
jgi:hypothetical protein